MSYATVEQFQAAMQGDHRTEAYGATDSVIVQRWLDAATGRMDAAFVEAGYSAPIDVTQAGEHEAALEALLSSRCMDLALRETGFALDVGEGKVMLAGQRADDWLGRLQGLLRCTPTGAVERFAPSEHLPGLQRRGGRFVQVAGGPIKTQTQEAHGFAVLDALCRDGADWIFAQADQESTLARAIAVKVRSVDRFDVAYLTTGEIELVTHGLGDAGAPIYLSQDTAGLLTVDEPESGIVQQVAEVKDADHLILLSGTVRMK